MIAISVNNKIEQFDDPLTIEKALHALGYGDKEMLGIALNQTFVTKEQWNQTRLKQGDKIDILNPVSGG